MRVIRKLAATAILIGLPLSLIAGCAPGGTNGTPVTPAASNVSPSQPAAVQSVAWSTAPKTAQWPQFGYGPGHTGYNPLESTIDAQTVSNLQVTWNDQSIVQPSGIVVDAGVAYVDDMGQTNAGLYALDATTGAQKWYANVNLNGSWGSFTHAVAAVAGNVVVTPCGNGSSTKFLTGMCGVSAATGKTLWKKFCQMYQNNPCGGLGNGGSSPALYNGAVYYQVSQGINEQPDTLARNAKTGALLWSVGGVYHCPDAGETGGNALPAANGVVFAVLGCQGQQGGTEICALSAANGTAMWCDTSQSPYVNDMIASNGKLYVIEPGSNNDNVVIAFNASTGAQVWTATIAGASGPALAATGASVFVEDGGTGVYALSASTGSVLWTYNANANLYLNGVISVADGIVYTDGGGGNNGNVALAALSAKTGSVIWTSGSVGNGSAPMTPVIVNGTVYAGCYTVCSFNLAAKRIERR